MTGEKLERLIAEAESDQIQELHQALDRAQVALAKEKNHSNRLVDAVYRASKDAALARDLKPTPPRKAPAGNGSPEVAVPWIADLQLGKVTPTYNSDIAAERIDRYADRVLDLVDLQRSARPVDEAHVWLMGDIVEGEDIFPGQAWLIDSSLYRQVVTAGPQILVGFLRRMLGSFEKVHVVAVIGNHGRIGRRGQMSPETNSDRMVYEITRQLLVNETRLTWTVPEPTTGDRGWYAVDTIGAYSCLLVHGDQFKGQLGIPWYGVRKKVLGWKAMASAPDLPFPEFQDVAFGHWHQPMSQTINGIGVRGSGSPESWNDYAAENLAGMGRPSQRLMFVSPSKGIVTAEYPEVWLD